MFITLKAATACSRLHETKITAESLLPDGRQQLKVRCETVVDYATLPKELLFGNLSLFRGGWDSEKKIAFYRPGLLEDL